MNTGFATRVIAAVAALSAFAIAILSGMASGNDSALVLRQALTAMLLAFVGGAIIGAIGERTVREHVERYRAQTPENPAPAPVLEAATNSPPSTDSPPRS